MTKDENSSVSNKQSGVGTEAFIESDGKNQLKGKLGDKSILISGASDKKFNQQRTIINDGKYLPKILHDSNVADVNKNAKQVDNVNAGGKEDLNDADGNKMVIKMPFFNDVDNSDGKIKSPVRNVSSKMVSTLKRKDNDSSLRNDSNNNDNNDDDDGDAVKNDNKNDGSELNKNRSGKEMKNNDDSNFNNTGNDNENVEYGKDDENADDNTTNETNVADDKRLMINDKYPIEKVLKTAKNKAEEELVNRNDFFPKKFYKRNGSQTADQQQQQQQGQSTKQPQQKLKQSQTQQQSLQQQFLLQQQKQGDIQPQQLQRHDSSHLAEKQQQKSSQPPLPPSKPSNFSIQHEQLEQQSKKLQNDSRNELTPSASMPTKSNNLIESKEKSLESRRKEHASILDGQQNDNRKTPDSKTSKLDKLEDKLEDVADDDEDVPKKENSIRAGNQNLNVIIRNNYTNNDILFQKRNRF
ncbi:hypothetical protein HELRODRAFT_174974 [Helobdella robusta]|uniref:Uncharacterized protein n=1 Tax=Helobdella robusta TaxID=6412 RepID=T1F8N8_HELRO|nr:hypothetical protein HELRODRAFT_174974 [Helobdella robusta]ESO01415.1 hypothetical protein HELRODRAFT_174974 [Helobdella robusta]